MANHTVCLFTIYIYIYHITYYSAASVRAAGPACNAYGISTIIMFIIIIVVVVVVAAVVVVVVVMVVFSDTGIFVVNAYGKAVA